MAINYFQSPEEADILVRTITSDGGNAAAIQADMAEPSAISRLVEETVRIHGGLDILVNNVGQYTEEGLIRLPVEKWDWVMNTNLRSSFLAAQAIFPYQQAAGWGRIVNIAAGSAFVRNHSAYGLAKQAVCTLTEVLALELAPTVTVNAVAPGLVDDPDVPGGIKDSFQKDTPLRRLVTYQQVADLTALFCSPAFDMVTGQVIAMDGGQTIPRALVPVE